MHYSILALHSLLRWFVLAALLYALFRAYKGWFGKQQYTSLDNKSRLYSVVLVHIQLIIGLALYFLNPEIKGFFSDFKTNVRIAWLRFFGMEHLIMMLVAIVLITIGSAKAKRQTTDEAKFKTIAIWFTVAMVLILASIPFAFRGAEIARPLFRSFF